MDSSPSGEQPAVITNEASVVAVVPEPASVITRWKPVDQVTTLLHRHTSVLLATISFFVIVGVLATVYTAKEERVAVKQFTNVYSFVPEKVSKSAAIAISVPNGVTEDIARANISFSPVVEGEWLVEEQESVVMFKPKQALKSGVYYAVNLDTEAIQMSGDFYVDEDPQIETIFPLAGSEANEASEITIVFNRPMVPLTTLTVQESVELPITITPATPGKFKWISSRNLQFIPETTLIPASNYTVTVGAGLASLDGLQIAPLTHTFVTRPLRYEYISENQVGYRSPIIIAFNQPVDLAATKRQIAVTTGEGENVSLEVVYGESTYYDSEAQKQVTTEDRSKLFIYQTEDQHGRNRLWDFNTSYTVTVSGAVPEVGTVLLTEGRHASVFVPNIVQGVQALSERTSLARPDFLDPQGSLTVTFYDEIDKNASTIKAKGLKNIAYGERCQTDEFGDPVWRGESCEKEVDTKTLLLTFDPAAFSTNESFDLTLDKIFTTDGFRTNTEPIVIGLKTYPALAILRTFPEAGATDAALNGMTVCSNAPLGEPVEQGLGSYVATTGYIVFGRWSNSFYVEAKSQYNKCETGEFETVLPYGLLPETDYSLQLTLRDVFDQSADRQLSLQTRSPEGEYTRFHNMQQQYQVTTPDRTKLTYAVENLEYVDMHICKLSPETFLARVVEMDSQYTSARGDGCLSVVSKQIPLPARYWVNNYFQVNLADYFTDPRGHYIVTFSHPLYRDETDKKPLYDRTYVSVTNLAVGKKEIEDNEYRWSASNNPRKESLLMESLKTAENLYWVNDSRALAPIANAVVTQYTGGDDQDFTRVASGITNSQGIARVSTHKNIVGAVVTVGGESAVVSDWADQLGYAGSVQDASKTYVYTDRPIYRPGQTVYIKGIDRIGFDGSYEVWRGEAVPLLVFDAEGNSMYETKLEQSLYGTFATSIELPSDAALGTYRIEAFGQSFYFDVEEYVPAAFKLEASTDKEEYINGDTFTLDVQADYYFGVPLSEGTVSYSVTAQDYYFDKYTDEYFNFGGGWYYCYSCGYGDNFLFRGESRLNENGRAVIKQPFDFAEYFENLDEEGSKLVTVSVTVKDSNGRSVSLQKSFVVHKGEFYLGAKTDEYYTSLDTPNTLRLKTVDTTGKPRSVSAIERVLYKVEWETFKRQEVDGGFYYRSEKKLTEVSREKVKTNDKGDWSGQFTVPQEGQYEIQVSATDDRGTKLKTTTNVYVYGRESVSVPPNNNYELNLEVEKTDVAVGEMASILIKSPYPRAKALVAVERGTVYDYWIVDVVGGLYLHEFPIKSAYAPNVSVSVLLLSPDPEVKYGTTYFTIDAKEKALSVEVTADKLHYLPGESVTLNVKTTNYKGEPAPAEVSIAVADLSVLALKGNPKKNPLVFFYDGFPLSVSTASNIKNILYEVDIPLGTKGGGGASPDDLAKKKRGTFKDTAFWEAFVVTNEAGEATVTFTLPDNLTTWQVETLGVTLDTKLGVGYHEFTTKKDLMAVPLKPRFVVPGDEFSLGATIFNQTSAGSNIAVVIESSTLAFTGKTTESVFVNAGESKTVYFDAVAPKDVRAGAHQFTFTASNEEFADSVEQSIAITPNTTYETVATAQATKADVSVEYLYVPDTVIEGEGGLTINANATMAVFMTDALSYMVTYPYGCSEQLASALSTIGIMTDALTIPNVTGDFSTIDFEGVTYTVDTVVKDGLARIYETQTLTGGFAYYKGLESDLALTTHVVSALFDLQSAGYEIKESVLEAAVRYIEQESLRLYTLYPEQQAETVILAEYVLRQVTPDTKTSLTEIVQKLIKDESFLEEKISSMSLAYLATLTATNYSAKDKDRVYTVLQNRLAIDGRGAYLTPAAYENRAYYETSIKNTALALAAMVAHDDEHVMLPNLLRWLLASKDTRGAWGSTHNTFIVVRAMVDYLQWQHESEAAFNLRGLLDGVEIFGHEFNPKNVFETFTHFIAMDKLPKATLVPLKFEKEDTNGKENNLYYDLTLKYFLPVESLPPRDEGITITRDLYALSDARDEKRLAEVRVGDVVRGKLVLTIPGEYRQVAIEDYIPAGFEIVNFNLSTEDQSLLEGIEHGVNYDEWYEGEELGFMSGVVDSVRGIFGGSQAAQVYQSSMALQKNRQSKRPLRPTHTEAHDDRVFLYVENLQPGVYEYEYYLRALVPGTFQRLPARAEELYFPEVFGRTSGELVKITAPK